MIKGLYFGFEREFRRIVIYWVLNRDLLYEFFSDFEYKYIMKITTWNVNSINVRLPHLLELLKSEGPIIIGLQELKCTNEKYPLEEISHLGYFSAVNGQPTYNGVSLISTLEIKDVIYDIPGFQDDEKRVITGTIDGVRVINAYVPNGQSPESDKYQYKLAWLVAFTEFVQAQLELYPELVVIGDFNIAPKDEDVHNPASWAGKILCTDQERAAFQTLLKLGLLDGVRIEAQPKDLFTWWDYREGGFEKNSGIRIDHLLLSRELSRRFMSSSVHLNYRAMERPSDHAPVSVVLK